MARGSITIGRQGSARVSSCRDEGISSRDDAGRFQGGGFVVPVAMPIQTDWVKSVLFDRGYLSRIRGEAIKVYLVMLEGCGGAPDRSVTISLSQLTRQTRLSSPTV